MGPDSEHGFSEAAEIDLRVEVAPGPDGAVEVERVALPGSEISAAVIQLARSESWNQMDSRMVEALATALVGCDRDRDVGTILITGTRRVFSAGVDVRAQLRLGRDPVALPRFVDRLQTVFGSIRSASKPVVALVNGITTAGGLELLLACDFAVAGSSAEIGDEYLDHGLISGGGVLSLLPRAIGPARARELVFSGRMLSAAEALEWRLVNQVVPDDDLLAAGLAFATVVAEKSSEAIAAAKYVMNAGWADGTGLDSALRLERDRSALYRLTLPDAQEGLTALVEKRRPRYPGR
ncbi:MAG TPA: enoyl-CoA hydratase/isomerase family protein [Acidimicrobiia bacterium]|nr:enoyl-CoA hydratase/isomerase family protein [Acidimicrobiia bacterium]